MEQAARQFLGAASAEERGAAERLLLDFRKSATPLAVCRHLLLHSSVGFAKLQALCTMRECLGTLWAALQPAERSELQLLLLRLVANEDGGAAEQYVIAAAAQLLAVHAKHDLVRSTDSGGGVAVSTLIDGASQMLHQPGGAHADAAIAVLNALLTEFGAPSAGAMGGGLPWSMHAPARQRFEEHHLLAVAALVVQYLQRLHHAALSAATPPVAALPPPLAHAITQCASLLCTALSWEFGGIGEAAASDAPRPGLNATVVRPPASADGWMALLRGGEALGAVADLLEQSAMAARGGGEG